MSKNAIFRNYCIPRIDDDLTILRWLFKNNNYIPQNISGKLKAILPNVV